MTKILIHYPLGVPLSGKEGIISNSQTKQVLNRALNRSFGDNGILETYIQTTRSDSFVFELTLKPRKTIQDVNDTIAGIMENLPQITITTQSHE